MKEHLQYTFFRQSAIEACMESGEYRRVIKLAQEGELQDQQLPGLLTQWKKARYDAYKKHSMKNEQRLLARELLLGGDYAYYQELESFVASQVIWRVENHRQWRERWKTNPPGD